LPNIAEIENPQNLSPQIAQINADKEGEACGRARRSRQGMRPRDSGLFARWVQFWTD